MGLEDLAARELQRALEIDPTSESVRQLTIILPLYLAMNPDEYFAAVHKIAPDVGLVNPWYYLRKGRFDEAQKALDERLSKDPNNYDLLMQQALFLALKGDFRGAEARVPGSLPGFNRMTKVVITRLMTPPASTDLPGTVARLSNG